MTRGIKIRLMAFVVLSAVGITYVTASYLGVIDRVLGRNIVVTASLPGSGGLYEGSAVTYRGVKIGMVKRMRPTPDGIHVEATLQPGTELPLSSSIHVHNLSAIGEQYLDFRPPSNDPPYAESGDHFDGDENSLPVAEADLLVDLDAFVNSVDQDSLVVAVRELGELFEGTGADLQKLLDGGSRFIEEAAAHTDETVALLENGLTVLNTQRDQKENIRRFAEDLNTLTSTLASNDSELRTIVGSTPSLSRELRILLEQLEPTLPILLSDLVTINQIIYTEIDGVEQLLVTYPPMIAGGPTGSTIEGWGHVNLQFDYSVPPCTEGYLPPGQWRSPHDLSETAPFPAECLSGPPYQMRGPKMVPAEQRRRGAASPGRHYSVPRDPVTGELTGVTDADGNPVRFQEPQDLSVLGGDAWKWMLVGPVATE